MSTKPKVPPYAVPVVGEDGRANLEWFRALSQPSHVGAPDTTVGAAGGAAALPATPTGYISIVVNNETKLVPFYDPA